MLSKVLGTLKTKPATRKLRGGPQSLKPMSPMKGSGVKNGTGLASRVAKNYVTPKQNPATSPNTGGIAMRGTTPLRGKKAVAGGKIGLKYR